LRGQLSSSNLVNKRLVVLITDTQTSDSPRAQDKGAVLLVFFLFFFQWLWGSNPGVVQVDKRSEEGEGRAEKDEQVGYTWTLLDAMEGEAAVSFLAAQAQRKTRAALYLAHLQGETHQTPRTQE
jgi:hypothetical protein